uniref:Uncharacterized protein n=2 Tax=Acidianus ambivalens TaxID=2283 RepID=Q8NKU3_ACIAM|nr:hypothetical protein [Acidianus ambivalens]
MYNKKYTLKAILGVEGILLFYSGIMLALASNNEIKEMMFLAKVKPLIPIPFVFMIIAFIFNGTMFLLSISDRFMLFLIRNTFQSIIIRALMVCLSFVMINPMFAELTKLSSVNFMSPATAPGLLFPGGLLVHVLLEHWLGGIMGFGMGIYPKLFTRIKIALGSKIKK